MGNRRMPAYVWPDHFMKLQFLALASLLTVVGCAESRQHLGAAVDTDKNVLTGGPITGTTIQDLPQAVKNTLKQTAPQAEIADIDKVSRDSKEAFEISFAQPGKNSKVFISKDGTVLPGSEEQK
jgi:hypothetical protein